MSSAAIGLGAKLAIISNEKAITAPLLLRNIFIAALAVWITYNLCKVYAVGESATYIYVALSARFADAIVLILYQALKNMVNKFGE